MTLLINTGFVNEFNDRLRDMVQQTNSKLKDKVNVETINSEFQFIDKVGKVKVTLNNDAFAPISNFEPSYERRRLLADRFVFDMLFDKNKMRKMITDSQYQSQVVNQMKAAFERKMDKVLITGLNAIVFTGKSGATPLTAAADGVQTIDATAGTTYEKLREAKRKLMAKGWNMMDGYDIFHLITEQELDSYEQELELVSGDYTRNNAVKRDEKTGQIVSALGIRLITFASSPEQEKIDPPLLDVTAGTRDCFLMVGKTEKRGFPGAITLGMERMLEWDIVKDPTRHDTWILKGAMNIGAVRENGSAVELFQTTELV